MIKNDKFNLLDFSFEKSFYNKYFSTNEEIQKYIQFQIKFKKIKPHKQPKYDISQSLYIGRNFYNYFVFYWSSNATNKYINDDPSLINSFKSSHSELKNYGITKIDKFGYIKIFLQTPQIFYTNDINQNKNFVPRMVNFIIYNNQKWISNKIFSQLIILKIDFKQFMIYYKKKNKLIINSNDSLFFSIKNIPNTANLPFNSLNKNDNHKIIKWIEKIIENQCIEKKNTKIDKYNIYLTPIIIYNNLKNHKYEIIKVADYLFNLGFINLYYTNITSDNYYKHTVKNYDNKKKKKIYIN